MNILSLVILVFGVFELIVFFNVVFSQEGIGIFYYYPSGRHRTPFNHAGSSRYTEQFFWALTKHKKPPSFQSLLPPIIIVSNIKVQNFQTF